MEMSTDFLKIDSEVVKNNLINLKQLVFEVTDRCNLKCKYCGYGELYEGYDERKSKSLQFTKARLVIDYLVALWSEHIRNSFIQPITLGFYGGEPLMNMHFIKELIQYVEGLGNVGKLFQYNMTTNGLLLNRHQDYLVEKKITLLISLDGNEKDHSYRVDAKGRNSHKRVVENIRLLQQSYPEYFTKQVNFNTVLHNMNSVESAYYYIKNNFGKTTTISPLNNSGIRPDKMPDFIKTYQNVNESIRIAENCEQLESEMFIKSPNINQLANFFYNHSGNVIDNYSDLLIDKNKLNIPPTGTCTPFFKKMFITVNGKILPCERVNHEFEFGQIQDKKLDLDLQLIAERFNDYVFSYVEQCRICSTKHKCSQCVFQIDDIHDPNSKCKSFTSPEVYKKYIQTQLNYLGEHPELYEKIIREVVITN